MSRFPESELQLRRQVVVADFGLDSKFEDVTQLKGEPTKKVWNFKSPDSVILNVLTDSLDLSSKSHKTYNNPSRIRRTCSLLREYAGVISCCGILSHLSKMVPVPRRLISRHGVSITLGTTSGWSSSIASTRGVTLKAAKSATGIVRIPLSRDVLRVAVASNWVMIFALFWNVPLPLSSEGLSRASLGPPRISIGPLVVVPNAVLWTPGFPL